MTNRTTYTLFTKADDPEIQDFLDMEKNVLVYIGGEILQLKQRKGSLGTYWLLKFVTDEKEIYGRFQTSECKDIEEFLKIVKEYLKQ